MGKPIVITQELIHEAVKDCLENTPDTFVGYAPSREEIKEIVAVTIGEFLGTLRKYSEPIGKD